MTQEPLVVQESIYTHDTHQMNAEKHRYPCGRAFCYAMPEMMAQQNAKCKKYSVAHAIGETVGRQRINQQAPAPSPYHVTRCTHAHGVVFVHCVRQIIVFSFVHRIPYQGDEGRIPRRMTRIPRRLIIAGRLGGWTVARQTRAHQKQQLISGK